ncbi:MAG: alkyl sulfatase C-terminal domain-containing protein [Gammaproteobacteria bacterium]|nr:alkyl sulfatase C-terminal domain-containing protein [Gammaproteobacteria bacterium]
MARSIPLENLFLTMAVRLNGPRADGVLLRINLEFTDAEPVLMTIENAVLHAFPNRHDDAATATMKLSSLAFKRLMMGLADAMNLMQSGELEIDGEAGALLRTD